MAAKQAGRPMQRPDTTIVDQMLTREILPEPKYEDGQTRPLTQLEFYNDRAIAHVIEAEWLYREFIKNARACIPSKGLQFYREAKDLLKNLCELSTAAAVRMRLQGQETHLALPETGPKPVKELSDAELEQIASAEVHDGADPSHP